MSAYIKRNRDKPDVLDRSRPRFKGNKYKRDLLAHNYIPTVAEKNVRVKLEAQRSITTAPFQCGTLYKPKRFPKGTATAYYYL